MRYRNRIDLTDMRTSRGRKGPGQMTGQEIALLEVKKVLEVGIVPKLGAARSN